MTRIEELTAQLENAEEYSDTWYEVREALALQYNAERY